MSTGARAVRHLCLTSIGVKDRAPGTAPTVGSGSEATPNEEASGRGVLVEVARVAVDRRVVVHPQSRIAVLFDDAYLTLCDQRSNYADGRRRSTLNRSRGDTATGESGFVLLWVKLVITMEYVYAALILHEADQEIAEESVTDVLEAAGANVEESRVRALVAALEDVDIDEAVAEAAVGAPTPATPAAEEEEAPAEEAEEPEEEEEDVSGEGLGELFG